ncbi:hypothetical protein [Actinomadura geliboluensis]|uniref:hypothetical protein n=1 Tax=Actinomadura geliboluensis TaxID=882440 RepID=UPI003713D17D
MSRTPRPKAEVQDVLVAAQPQVAEDAGPHFELADAGRPQVRADEQRESER